MSSEERLDKVKVRLAEIYRNELQLGPSAEVSESHAFIDAGGSSLNIQQVRDAIAEVFGVAVDARMFFEPETGTFSNIAQKIADLEHTDA